MNQTLNTFAIFFHIFIGQLLPIAIFNNNSQPDLIADPIVHVQKTTPVIIKPIAQSNVQPISEAIPIQTPPSPTPATPSQSSTDNSACGDNSYANYIYNHESGCSTTIANAGGCLGIGQACPGSKLLAVCPNLDYACENSFFTNYANATYGGWAGAYSFWTSHSWW